jgi:hypothetical protein
MQKTVAKMAIVFAPLALIFSPLLLFPFLIPLYLFGAFVTLLMFALYYWSKKAFTYYINSHSVRVSKHWIFGNYDRQLTFDKIQDVHLNQGIIAKAFRCGSLAFVTTTGLEVGYRVVGGGAATRRANAGVGFARPIMLRGAGNTFMDISNPASVRETLMNSLTEWRDVFQQQKIAQSTRDIAASLSSVAQRSTPQPAQPTLTSGPSMADLERLSKLKSLLDAGVISKDEFESQKNSILQPTKTPQGTQSISATSCLDDELYTYIMRHGGKISLSTTANDLGISAEQVKGSIQRLRQSHRLK